MFGVGREGQTLEDWDRVVRRDKARLEEELGLWKTPGEVSRRKNGWISESRVLRGKLGEPIWWSKGD